MIDDEDRSLVCRTLAGDRRAFEQIVERYQKVIYNVALRMRSRAEDAEDITQSVFLKAYESLGTYKPRYKFFSWIYRIAVNESLNFVNRQKQHEELDQNIPDLDPSAEQVADEHDLTRIVDEGLMRLRVEERAIIVLNHFHNLSYGEIGYILDIPEKTVKSRLYSARQLLRTRLLKGHLIQ
ncbi:MAG: sigma-70 family RNA polymerase sigma factor [Ignavibacteria bacterium]|nr:MAG: sigma-70 family RNA polymerase sigma factor [Ignavibacteria bacterium]